MFDGVWWHTPHTITYARFSGTLTLRDIQAMMEKSYALMDTESSVEGACNILDLSRCEHYASDLMNMQAMRLITRSHPKTRWVVIIDPTPNPAVRFIGISILKILRLNFSPARSEAEALGIIARVMQGTSQP